MNFSLGNFWYLFLLLLLPIVTIFIVGFKKWKKERQQVFADASFQQVLFAKESRYSSIFPVLYFLAFLFLVFAMVDLLGGKQKMKVQQKTNSVVFLLDVSNSMNAQDVQPNRLELAKSIIINSIQNIHDGKVGVIVFAGEAESIMPLTLDYSAAETYLSGIETNIVGRQGTDFLKAVEVAAKKFKNIPKGSRKIILISDGEDNEGNDKAAIDEAQKEGIVINSVSVGSDEGAPIPIYEFGQLMGYKTDSNEETIITKRQSEALMSLAYDTNGEYIDGNNLNNAIAKITNILKQKGTTTALVDTQTAIHYYQIFLVISLFLFFLIYLINPKKDLNF